MIIELFGPPGAGKTTFARTLAARLRERGHTVDLILSYRPAELSPHEIRSSSNLSAQQISSMIRRLIRPLAEMLTIASHPFTISQDVGTALTLIKILPPSHPMVAQARAIRVTSVPSVVSGVQYRPHRIV